MIKTKHNITFSQVIISTRRLSRFISSSSDCKSKREKTDDAPSQLLVNDQSEFTTEEMAVVFHEACCAWSISDNEEQNFTLNNVTLGLRKGSFTAVIGEVRIVPYTFQLWYFKIP